MGASCSGSWQWAQRAGRCSTTASGVATSRSVSPRWPSCPPAFLPLRLRRLFVLLGLRPNPSLEGGFELVGLSWASRACSVCSCTDKASTCARSAGSSLTCARSLALSACRPAFSASSSAIRAASVMRLCYARYASPPDLLQHDVLHVVHGVERDLHIAVAPTPNVSDVAADTERVNDLIETHIERQPESLL